MNHTRFALILAAALALPASLGAQPATTAPLPRDVHWFRNSAEYKASMIQAYRLAGRQLEARSAGLTSGTWAVVLDADETVIDNSTYQKELAEQGVKHTQAKWQAWARREEATPLPGAVSFLHKVQEKGGKVVIVTNRSAEVQKETEAVFHKQQIPYDLMLCRNGNQSKEDRMKLAEEGKAAPGVGPLKIVLWVGDNIQDFPGMNQELREKEEDAFADFGDRYIVLPNPMYGSWERNPRK